MNEFIGNPLLHSFVSPSIDLNMRLPRVSNCGTTSLSGCYHHSFLHLRGTGFVKTPPCPCHLSVHQLLCCSCPVYHTHSTVTCLLCVTLIHSRLFSCLLITPSTVKSPSAFHMQHRLLLFCFSQSALSTSVCSSRTTLSQYLMLLWPFISFLPFSICLFTSFKSVATNILSATCFLS